MSPEDLLRTLLSLQRAFDTIQEQRSLAPITARLPTSAVSRGPDPSTTPQQFRLPPEALKKIERQTTPFGAAAGASEGALPQRFLSNEVLELLFAPEMFSR